MDAQPNKVTRRKPKAPSRRVPVLHEERQNRPMIFGWGAHLNRHQQDALKERIALFAGIALAVVVVVILGIGLLKDNVIDPMNARAADNKPIATIGNYTIRAGFFKRFELFRQTQNNNNIAQLQQNAATLKPKDPQVAQIQAEVSALQQQQSTLAPDSLAQLIDDQTLIQRSRQVGVVATPKAVDNQILNLVRNAGGKQHFAQFVQSSGLSMDEFRMLTTSDYLRTKVADALGKKVSATQEKVRASHILVPATKTALAKRLLAEAKAGANFAQLAHKYSTDTNSAKHGGDLGYNAHGVMVPPFDKAMFSMKVGQIRLVKSQYGWHIIKVTGIKQFRRTPSELQQAKSAALTAWLAQQQTILRVQRFVAPAALPNVATPSALTSTNPIQQVPSTNPNPVTVPKPVLPKLPVPKTGKNPTKKP